MAESEMKRLFLFAAYDPLSTVSEALVHTVGSFAENGDVVLFADCTLPGSELEKLRPYVLYAGTESHGEYDFGSYKRCWEWACSNLDVNSYDYVYMVNDSVYGPFGPLTPFLSKLEGLGCQAFGPVFSTRRRGPHIQSWFIGLGKDVFTRPEFDAFLRSVERQCDKRSVCKKYETGLTRLLREDMAVRTGALFCTSGKRVYNDVLALFRSGLPFLKKAAFSHHDGAIGGQISLLLREISASDAVTTLSDAERALGREYVNNLLTTNPLRLIGRGVKHILKKL